MKKRGRGRPPLSAAEKERRAAERAEGKTPRVAKTRGRKAKSPGRPKGSTKAPRAGKTNGFIEAIQLGNNIFSLQQQVNQINSWAVNAQKQVSECVGVVNTNTAALNKFQAVISQIAEVAKNQETRLQKLESAVSSGAKETAEGEQLADVKIPKTKKATANGEIYSD